MGFQGVFVSLICSSEGDVNSACRVSSSGPLVTFIELRSRERKGQSVDEECRWSQERTVGQVYLQRKRERRAPGFPSAHHCKHKRGRADEMNCMSDMENLHTIFFCLCVLGGVCVWLGGGERLFAIQARLHERGLLQSQLFTRVWPVLHIYDTVVCLESLP